MSGIGIGLGLSHHPVLGRGARLPDDADPYHALCSPLVENDLVDHETEHLLAMAVSDPFPKTGQVDAERGDAGAIVGAQCGRLLLLPPPILLLDLFNVAQLAFPSAV